MAREGLGLMQMVEKFDEEGQTEVGGISIHLS